MIQAVLAVFFRDLLLTRRNVGDHAISVVFFVVVVTMFSFAGDSNPQMLRQIGGAVICVGALLSAMLSLDGLFRADYEDGALDLMLTAPVPAFAIVIGKVAAHWISTGAPLIAISPVLGILMNLDRSGIWALVLTLVASTPVFSLIGAFGASLVIAQKRAGVLLSLLVLPLCVPVLIFSIAAIDAAQSALPYSGHISLLAAYLVFSITLAPLATAATLRITSGG